VAEKFRAVEKYLANSATSSKSKGPEATTRNLLSVKGPAGSSPGQHPGSSSKTSVIASHNKDVVHQATHLDKDVIHHTPPPGQHVAHQTGSAVKKTAAGQQMRSERLVVAHQFGASVGSRPTVHHAPAPDRRKK
jgi:hypothetical protein